MMQRFSLFAVLLALCALSAFGQTTINGQRVVVSDTTIQGTTTLTGTTKTVNFEAALPGTCTAPSSPTPGELVFRTSDNTLHACTALNTFTQIGGGGGGVTVTLDTYANEPASCTAGDLFRPTDSPMLKGTCVSANTWAYDALGRQVTLPTGTWSFVNPASSTQSQTFGGLKFVTPKSGSVSITALCRTPDISINGVFDFEVLVDDTGRPPGSVGTIINHGFGAAFYESGTGKFVTTRIFVDASGQGIATDKWTNATTFSAVYSSYQSTTQGIDKLNYPIQNLRLDFSDNTNLVFFWSADRGTTWEQLDTRAKADFFTTAPDQVCVFNYANGDRVVSTLIHYEGN